MSEEQLQADGCLTDERTVHEDMDKYVKDVQRGCFHTQEPFDLQHRHTFKVMELL